MELNSRLRRGGEPKRETDIYIYIYIYICVCVCVCVCLTQSDVPEDSSGGGAD
jgi:hypothetical protein